MFRYLALTILLHFTEQMFAQHVPLHWYNLKSVAPLDLAEGKMALTRMKQVTSDSLATFTDRGDHFSLATKEPIDWQLFAQTMEDAGYFIADITHTETHHSDFVKMGLAYQQACFLLEHPNELQSANAGEPVQLTHDEFLQFSTTQQSELLLYSTYFHLLD